MRRRDFSIGLVLASTVRMTRAQEPAKQHRIAIIESTLPVTRIHETGSRFYQAIFGGLRRLGDVEGQNLNIERYSGEGRPESYADLAREVVNRNPDVIVALTDAVARAVRAATGTIPIIWVGDDPIRAGLVTSLARPEATLPALPSMRETKSGGSASKSSRKPSLQQPE